MRQRRYWMGFLVVCSAILASGVILKLMSVRTATVAVDLPVVGAHSWAVVLMAALYFGNGVVIGSLLRSWWVFIYSSGLTGTLSLLAICSNSGEMTREFVIELTIIEALIPGTLGVLVGVIAGRLILGRFHQTQHNVRPDAHAV